MKPNDLETRGRLLDMILTTERLHLRCMEPKDIEPFVRDLSDWEVQQWLAQPPFPYARTDGEWYLDVVRKNHKTSYPTTFVVADKESDAALGAASIDIDGAGTGVLGYWFGRDHWGRGIAQEAVGALVRHARKHPSIRTIVAVTDLENLRSQRVLAASGLTDCGIVDREAPSRRGATQMRRYELVIAKDAS